jgi:hypothetical protein
MQNTWDSDKSLYELRVHQFAILANSVLCSATTKSDETRSTNEDEDHTYVSLLVQPISIINHCNLRPPSSSLRTSKQWNKGMLGRLTTTAATSRATIKSSQYLLETHHCYFVRVWIVGQTNLAFRESILTTFGVFLRSWYLGIGVCLAIASVPLSLLPWLEQFPNANDTYNLCKNVEGSKGIIYALLQARSTSKK